MKKRVWWIIGIGLVLVIAGFYTYRTLAARNSASAASLQTTTVQRGNVTSIISAAGTIRSNQSATISWQTNGKVGDLSAQLGQKVQINDVLASLDPNSLSQSIIQAQSDLIDAQTALDNLKKPQALQIAQAETALSDAKTAQENLLHPSQTAISQAEVAVINAQTAVDTAQKSVNAVKYGRGTDQQIASARADVLLAQDKVATWQAVYDRTPGDPETDLPKANALTNLVTAQNERDHAQAMLNWYLGKPTEAQVNEANTTLALAQAQLADAQDALARLKSPSQTDIDLAQAKVDDAQQTLDDLKNGPTQAELVAAQTRVTLAQAALNQANLTAPIAGTITDIEVMSGDMVSSGKTAFRIDDLSKLYVDLQVSEVDIPQLQVGQEATLTFDAISNKEYHGKVTKISMVGTSSQGVVNYPVTVQITDGDSSVLSGMTAALTVVVARHENVLVVPNQAIRTAGTQRTVTVLYEGQQIQVPVTVGLTGDSVTEVTGSALKEGDEVVITGSSSSSTNTTSSQTSGGLITEGGPGGPPDAGGVFFGP